QLKALLDRPVDQIRIIGIPADANVFVSGSLYDSGRHWGIGSAATMNFHPDLDFFAGSVLTQLTQRGAEVLNRRFLRHTLRKSHRLNLYPQGARVMCKIDELLSDINLFLTFRSIGRLKPGGGAVADQPDFALLEKPPHPCALLLVDGGLDPM